MNNQQQLTLKTLFDLSNNINILTDIDSFTSDLSLRGLLFEKLIKLLTLNNLFEDFKLLDGSINNLSNIKDKIYYIQNHNIRDSNIEGPIDIKVYSKRYNKIIFFSCKYYQCEKTIDNYDIEKIHLYLQNYKYINKCMIGLCVKNKIEFLSKLKHSRNKNVKNTINEDLIFDYEYFKKLIIQYNKDNFDTLNKLKPNLTLYSYQHDIMNKIKPGNNLIGACPRCGKSFIISGFIHKMNINNVMIITPIIKETIKQWINIFNNHVEFNDYKRFYPMNKNKLNEVKDKLNEVKNNNDNKIIIIISKQLIQNHFKEFNFNPDILIFDEHDFHGTTDLNKKIINKYNSKYNIFLTATYIKTIMNVPNLNVIKFNYGQLKQTQEKDKFPNQIFIHPEFDNNEYLSFINKQLNTNRKIDFTELFKIDKNLIFKNELQVLNFFNVLISGSNSNDPKNSIFNKLYYTYENNILQKYSLINKHDTLIWFLPRANIDLISQGIVKLLSKDKIFKNFEFLIINSKHNNHTDINNLINEKEKELKDSNKHGLIILCGGMLKRGITIKNCSCVFMLNNSQSYEDYIQSSFRCLSSNENKQNGVIVDFDFNRIISMFSYYEDDNILINDSIVDKIKYLINNHIIYFNTNPTIQTLCDKIDVKVNNGFVFLEYEQLKIHYKDINNLINSILDNYFNNVSNHIVQFKNMISSEIEKLNLNSDLIEILQNFNCSCSKNTKRITTQKIKLYDTQVLQNGQNKESGQITKSGQTKLNEQHELRKLKEDILPYLIPLISVLTYNFPTYKLLECLNIIKQNENLKNIFNDQCKIIYNNDNILNILIELINEIQECFNPSNIISNIKYDINKLKNDNNVVELLTFINEIIKIKNCEREQNGEVLTPSWLINQMLDKLYEIDNNIFKNEKLKWFDHSSGIGSFHVEVYKRLKLNFTHEYIIKNMLYFSEFNSKNVFICKLIFGNDINIYQGDTLKLDTMKYFNVDKFDIILGNPPYNSGGIRSSKRKENKDNSKSLLKTTLKTTSKTIWPEFIKYSLQHLKQNGYLLSINPNTWFKKDSKQFELLNYQIYYLESWNAGYSKLKINAEIPISIYILQLNKQKFKTKMVEFNNRYDINNIETVMLKNNISLPPCYVSIFYKTYDYISNNNLNLQIHNTTVKFIDKDLKINELENKNKHYGVKTYRIKDGLIFNELIKQHPDQNKNKIIIANKISLVGSFIDNGKYGICGRCFYILGNENENNEINKLNDLLNTFNFKLYNLMCKVLKYSQEFLDKELFNYIVDIRKLNISVSEKELYKLIDFNELELEIINKF